VVALERAWRSLMAVADARAGVVADPGALAMAVEAVVEFAGAHPGALEQRLGRAVADVVGHGGRRVAALFTALAPDEQVRPYAAAVAALSPDGVIRGFARLRHAGIPVGDLCPGAGLQALVRRVAPATIDQLALPPEAFDALHALAGLTPLPDILPAQLAALAPAEVETLIEIYTGLPIAVLEARMRGGGGRTPVLGEDESLVGVILADAGWLASRRLDRHLLAARLAERFARLRAGERVAHCALTDLDEVDLDPFHTIDISPVHGRGRVGLRIGHLRPWRVAAHTVETVGRACFFGGHVAGRVEPARLVRLLDQ